MSALLLIFYFLLCSYWVAKGRIFRKSGIQPAFLLLLFVLHVGVGWIHESSGDDHENLSDRFRATGRDVTVEAFKSVFEKEIDGFSAIFHRVCSMRTQKSESS